MSTENKESALPQASEEKGEESSSQESPIEPEVLKDLPPEVRKAVESFSLQAFTGPVFHPVLKKVNEGHIDKVLDQSEKDSDREFQLEQSSKIYNLVYVLIFAALFIFITIYLANLDKELYRDVLKVLVGFIGGFGGGYGYKAFRDRDEG
jgi:hypothetical protein